MEVACCSILPDNIPNFAKEYPIRIAHSSSLGSTAGITSGVGVELVMVKLYDSMDLNTQTAGSATRAFHSVVEVSTSGTLIPAAAATLFAASVNR